MNAIKLKVTAIKNWDCENINVLHDLLLDLNSEMRSQEIRDIEEVGLDMSDLPSSKKFSNHDIMRNHTSYPIWACDNNGICLVGDDADSIESIDDIAEYFDHK